MSVLPHNLAGMNHIEFSVSRLRQIWDATSEEPQFLAEVAYLYDQIVQTGTHEPIIDMGMKLMIPFAEVGEAVRTAMELRYISAPKQNTFGGRITNKARKVLGLPIVKPVPKAKPKVKLEETSLIYYLLPKWITKRE